MANRHTATVMNLIKLGAPKAHWLGTGYVGFYKEEKGFPIHCQVGGVGSIAFMFDVCP